MRITRYPLVAFLLGLSGSLIAQESYGDVMASLASNINSSIAFAEASTVLVSPFQRMDGQGCEVDEVLTGDLEAALLAKPRMYKLLDRTNLAQIAEEHRLQLEGMMDDEQRFREALAARGDRLRDASGGALDAAIAAGALARDLRLTSRERDMLTRLAMGRTLREAASDRGVSERALQQLLGSARRKLAAPTTACAVAKAMALNALVFD